MIEHFLQENIDNTPFLRYQSTLFTRQDFVNEVLRFRESLLKQIHQSNIVYLAEEHPTHFFPLLFALWLLNVKVIFPTKSTLYNKIIPTYASHLVIVHPNNQPELIPNPDYQPINFDGNTVVFSSGSTGTPKGIVHDKNNFFLNAISTSNILKAPKGNSLTFLKPYLVSALSHFLVHWFNTSTLHFANFENLQETFHQKLPKKLNLVGSPIHITSSVRFMQEYDFTPDYFFTSGDMIADGIIEKILNMFSDVIFYKVYGLAEVGGRLFINTITKNDQIPGIGSHLSDATIIFRDKEIVVEAPYLFSGYIRNQQFEKIPPPFFTGDKIIQLHNHIILAGRKNDEIKIAGNKISLKYLENKIVTALKENKNIETGFVVAIPHPYFGNLLALILIGTPP